MLTTDHQQPSTENQSSFADARQQQPVAFVAVNVSLLISPALWVGLLGAAAHLPGLGRQARTAAAPRSRTFVLTSTATVPVPPAGTKTLDLWLPVPHADASQDVRDLKIESPVPYKIEQGAYGNQMLHLRPGTVPTAPLVVKLTAQITRREHLNLRANTAHGQARQGESRPQPGPLAGPRPPGAPRRHHSAAGRGSGGQSPRHKPRSKKPAPSTSTW